MISVHLCNYTDPNATHLIRAEIPSKRYWSKLGLLGLRLTTSKILTSRERTAWYTGVRLCLAVMITRIAPATIAH